MAVASGIKDRYRTLSPSMYRDGSDDFKVVSGEDAISESIETILTTRSTRPGSVGELPWRPSFGSRMQELRHKSLPDQVLIELARQDATESIGIWEKRAIVTGVDIQITRNNGGEGRCFQMSVLWVPTGVNSGSVQRRTTVLVGG